MNINIQKHPAYLYAERVVNGEIIAGKYIKIACQNFLEDVNNPNCKYKIDEEQLTKITGLTQLINMADGLRVGQSAHEALVGFQWFFIVNALCWYHKDQPEKRRYELAVLLIARKSGKSFLTALLILILMLIEPEFSQFFSVAPDRELSKIIKEEIEKMLAVSHSSIVKRFKTVQKETRCTLNNSKFIPLAYSENRMDGRKANAFVADEVGALRTSYPISAMQSSQINMVNRLGILISTAYDTTKNPMVDRVEYAEKVLNGEIKDETLFSLLYKPDDEEDWMSDEALLQANPLAIEIPENLEELKKKRQMAIDMPSEQTNFKTKHMNIFVDGDITEVYVSTKDLKRGRIKTGSYDWRGKEVYVGVDLSQTTDNTAVSMVTYDPEDDIFICKVWAFLPNHGVANKIKLEKVNYYHYKDAGYCFFSGDRKINHREIENFVMNLETAYGVKIKNIGYDRYSAIASANRWYEAGLSVTEIKQYSSTLNAPTKLLKEYIVENRFYYERNELFEINVGNAQEAKDTMLNSFINKKKSLGRVDMLAATINAIALWNWELEQIESVYNRRGAVELQGTL